VCVCVRHAPATVPMKTQSLGRAVRAMVIATQLPSNEGAAVNAASSTRSPVEKGLGLMIKNDAQVTSVTSLLENSHHQQKILHPGSTWKTWPPATRTRHHHRDLVTCCAVQTTAAGVVGQTTGVHGSVRDVCDFLRNLSLSHALSSEKEDTMMTRGRFGTGNSVRAERCGRSAQTVRMQK
jgi:hypothetical protein